MGTEEPKAVVAGPSPQPLHILTCALSLILEDTLGGEQVWRLCAWQWALPFGVCIFEQITHAVPVWYYLNLSCCPRKAGFLPSFLEKCMPVSDSIDKREGDRVVQSFILPEVTGNHTPIWLWTSTWQPGSICPLGRESSRHPTPGRTMIP